MDPLGTITMYYDFIDGETREALQSVAENSYSYRDFVKQLCDRVCADDSSDLLVYFATVHANLLWDYESLERLFERYNEVPIARPYFLISRSFRGESVDWDSVLESIEYVLTMYTEDWLLLDMYLTRHSILLTRVPGSPEEENALEAIENLIAVNDNLDCFSSYLLDLKANKRLFGGEFENALSFCQQALDKAREYHNQFHERCLLVNLALMYKSRNIAEAVRLLEEACAIAESLDDRIGLSNALLRLGEISADIGEYDEAIKDYLEVVRIREAGGVPLHTLPFMISMIYNEIGDAEEALEWARLAEETMAVMPISQPNSHLAKAWALIGLGEVGEASFELYKAKELVLKTGLEVELALHHFVSGVLERAEGDYKSAMHSFETALDINDRLNQSNRSIACILQLAESEVGMYEPTQYHSQTDEGEIWLDKLLHIADERQLDGIRGRAMILKAELRYKQNRPEEAESYLEEVFKLSSRPQLRYLQRIAGEKFAY